MNRLSDQALEAIPERTVCEVLNLNRNSFRTEKRRAVVFGPPVPAKTSRKSSAQPSALSEMEKTAVKELLNSSEYCDQPPTQVYYDLLEKGSYLCSVSTMHRILRQDQQNGERRRQRTPQSHAVPRLQASAVHQVWTWDITKLGLVQPGQYLSLYVVMDLYSRFVLAWMLSTKENSALASHLMQQAHDRYGITPGQLTIHQDRGAPMTAHCYMNLLEELSIAKSYSRPRVSNDNAVSEAQFKTMKYQPDYPRKFDSQQSAQAWCEEYFDWYNNRHHHSTLAGFTPEQVFTGRYKQIHEARQETLNECYRKHPQRFRAGPPKASMPPAVMFINPVCTENEEPIKEEVRLAN